MSSATALPIASTDSAETEKDRVSLWRCQELRRAGYGLTDALLLAVSHDVDLHLALELPARGCPHTTAVRILI
jgi:hypothetical protein